MFVIESRETPHAQWSHWTLLAPFPHREDAEIQQRHLAASQPYPTRSWQSVREFRVVEVPAGCPQCYFGAIGTACEWHRDRAALGATSPEPVALGPRGIKPLRPSRLHVNGADGRFISRRFAREAEAIGGRIRAARAASAADSQRVGGRPTALALQTPPAASGKEDR